VNLKAVTLVWGPEGTASKGRVFFVDGQNIEVTKADCQLIESRTGGK
jgi:hypothetical protein